MRNLPSRGPSRRGFLGGMLAAAAAPLVVPGRVLGLDGAVSPSNQITLGAIGIGNRSRAILPMFLSFKELRFTAVSDCRADRMAAGKGVIDGHYGNAGCRQMPDFRELLAAKDVDAVFIATGNRWHALASIYAARAGKDIYCEKPISLTIAESRALADTCRRHGTIFQCGTQRRSTASYRFAADMVRQGRLGRIKTVEMQVWEGPALPHAKAAPVPAGWDYDMWLGQVQWRPFVPQRVNAWQYFFDTADGMLTDMGCHYTDQMQWALERDHTMPVEFDGQAQFPDPTRFMSETPTTGVARCRYADGIEGVIHQRSRFEDRYIRYIGEEGWIQVDDQTNVVTAHPKSLLSLRSAAGRGWDDVTGHVQDLIHCIRKRTQPACNADVAHRAQSICLAMSISQRLGRKLKWDPVAERFDDEQANRLLWREPRAPWRI